MYNKTIIGWGFRDIQNNQGRGKGYQLKPKAEVDNLTETLIIQYNTKTESHNYFIIREKTKKNERDLIPRDLDMIIV